MMKHVAQQFIAQKLKEMTVDDLLSYSRKYGIPITRQEAEKIVKELRKSKENPFDPEDRKRMLGKLAKITSKETALSVHRLLKKVAKEYGVEHWL
ncbi:UNVERIFIED_CONTAM: DUF2624 domain-containing protein [Halobacillus marinus]|uniref:DUF2624 domain-containing protein n=1 Tax=Bacillaceae TaxID=186817 RepID=UPI0002A51A09|nr:MULTISPECIES: DUF2624 domain-containing protein [Bacillaceae]ELK45468.1 hypothetical protein D479_14467 [Halobacillus sp. BAB-2008]